MLEPRLCTTINLGTGDPLKRESSSPGKNSPFGNAIYAFDKGRHPAARRRHLGSTQATAGRSIAPPTASYYDQALVGIFEQNSFTNPPYVNHGERPEPEALESGAAARPRAPRPCSPSSATATTSRRGRVRRNGTSACNSSSYARGRASDVSYVGAHGDHLIRPDRHQLSEFRPTCCGWAASTWRAPSRVYGAITLRTTTARSNYWGILSSFRHNGGAGRIAVAELQP